MDIVFHRLAVRESREAEQWYALRSPDTAARFRGALVRAAEQLKDPSKLHAIGKTRFSYVRIARFPYRLILHQTDIATMEIVAVAHARRRPGYWRNRT